MMYKLIKYKDVNNINKQFELKREISKLNKKINCIEKEYMKLNILIRKIQREIINKIKIKIELEEIIDIFKFNLNKI